jgi:hypothetical protein
MRNYIAILHAKIAVKHEAFLPFDAPTVGGLAKQIGAVSEGTKGASVPDQFSGAILILIDFYVDRELLRAELRCPTWPH